MMLAGNKDHWKNIECKLRSEIIWELFRTCLHLSCLVGNEDSVKLLLQHKADPNRWDSSSERRATPLHCAASAKSLTCVKVNRMRRNKDSDLKFLWFGNLGFVFFQVLLSHGADVNAGLSERSPLHYAVLSHATEVVRELLEAGACPDTPQVGLL